MYSLVTGQARKTEAVGRALGEILHEPGVLICLNGPLGAGKTVLARGIACGLGIAGRVASPTFTLLHVYYSGRLPLYHFDFYRLDDYGELDELGLEEYIEGEGVTLLEWADKFPALLPPDYLEVRLEYASAGEDGEDVNCRCLTFSPRGSFYNDLLERMKGVLQI